MSVFDLVRPEKIGITNFLEVQLYPTYEKIVEYKIKFIHFVSGDEIGRCLPHINSDYDQFM